MKLIHFALSTCLVVGSMATLSVPAFAEGGHGRHGGGHGGGHVSQHQSGHYGNGHRSGRHHVRPGRQGRHGRSYGGHGNGGAFVAGTVVGTLLGWNGGYGYPRAHHRRYARHHRPYYAPRGHHTPRHHRRHPRRHYGYSDGGYHTGQGYQSHGGAGCHPVHRFGQWNGRPAKVGGTMCYNRNGRGYVVSGSRYLIHYR